MELIDAPIDLLEHAAALRLPPETEARRRVLLTRKQLGGLTPSEEHELAAWTALGTRLGALREWAEQLLCEATTPVIVPAHHVE